MKKIDYEKWKEDYNKKEFIDLRKYFDDKDTEILKKLGIELKDKLYTVYEFDLLDSKLLSFYQDEEIENDKLSETGVNLEEYEELLNKFDKVQEDYKL